MVPGSDPFAALHRALRPDRAAGPPGPDAGDDGLRAVPSDLRDAVPEGQPLLLVIDQLEELFTLVSDEDVRRPFLDGLVDVVD